MIDASTHQKLRQYPSPHEPPSNRLYVLDPELAAAVGPPGGNFVFLLPPTVHGYDIQANKWVELIVSRINPIKWYKQGFDELSVDSSTKELMKALVTSRVQGESGRASDSIRGKNGGLIMLFHGGPGTGKTFAAESIAELVEKPVQRISLSEVGTSVNELEKNMRTVLYLGKTWGSVILLDDSDILLEERTLSDLARNAMVATLIRLLDELDGIVILTSNRVGTFDDALRSRIHLAVHFESMDKYRRSRIWLKFITQAVEHGAAQYNLNEWVDILAEIALNGRQISNIFASAQSLASYQRKPLDYEILHKVISFSNRFDKYLTDIRGGTHDEERGSIIAFR
jgi:SpoVK/Ycf46/Vps4 family AAA+-type ATPase